MASKKISPPATKNRWSKGSHSSNICATVASSLMHITLFQQIIFFFLTMPISPAESYLSPKNVTITNNHTKILTVRCFTFYDEDTPATQRVHLQPEQSYSFIVKPHGLFPTATMYNCSTNMGVFTAYKYSYACATSSDPTTACEWMFDENQSYQKIDAETWKAVDYYPNYESLGRGGVVKGYFTN